MTNFNSLSSTSQKHTRPQSLCSSSEHFAWRGCQQPRQTLRARQCLRICAAAGSVSSGGRTVVNGEDSTPSDGEVVPLSTRSGGDKRFKKVKAFVAGATGGCGRAIVQRLAVEGVAVRALVRDPRRAAGVLPGVESGVEAIQGDVYQYATLPAAIGDSTVVIIATGSRPLLDPFGPFNVDYMGTKNLVAAAKQQGSVEKIVLVSSIGVDDTFFPLNLFFGVLFWKKRAEEAVQRSGIDHTIVRPGGLVDTLRSGALEKPIVMAGPDTFGLPPRRQPGSILRRQVADVVVEALVLPEASNKVVEIITDSAAIRQSLSNMFASI